jgi:hypothetical protein
LAADRSVRLAGSGRPGTDGKYAEIGAFGLSGDTYEWVHGPVGGNVFNVGLFFLIAAIALYSTVPATSFLWRQRNAAGREPAR